MDGATDSIFPTRNPTQPNLSRKQARRIFIKHKVAEVTEDLADDLLTKYPKDPNVFNMLKDVKVYLRWLEEKEAPAGGMGARRGGEEEEGQQQGKGGRIGISWCPCTSCASLKMLCTLKASPHVRCEGCVHMRVLGSGER